MFDWALNTQLDMPDPARCVFFYYLINIAEFSVTPVHNFPLRPCLDIKLGSNTLYPDISAAT